MTYIDLQLTFYLLIIFDKFIWRFFNSLLINHFHKFITTQLNQINYYICDIANTIIMNHDSSHCIAT